MRVAGLLTICVLLVCSMNAAADVLLRNVMVYDGTGRPPFAADVRVHGDRIATIAPHLEPLPGETVRDERGLSVAPGFIDMHSHGDGGLLEDLDAATVTRQGVTTIFVGQDGDSKFPLRTGSHGSMRHRRHRTSRAWWAMPRCAPRPWARTSTVHRRRPNSRK